MRTKTLTATALIGVLACTACHQQGDAVQYSDDAAASYEMSTGKDVAYDAAADAAAVAVDAAATADAAAMDATAAAAAASPAEVSGGPVRPAPAAPPARSQPATQIAYSYRYGVEVPSERAPALMRRHEAACNAAGAAVCQVLGSESRRYGRDNVSAELEMRAAPAWLDRFRAGLEGDAKRAGGRIAMASTDSEDLTRDLTDTAARLRALTTLRDRLQTLLATRSGPLDQLLATERELARVQGELDATQSALGVMQTRVAMSRVTLNYQSAREFAPDSAFTPVARAAKGSLSAFMGTLGIIIYTFATLLPVLLLGAPLLWLGWRHRRRLPFGKGRGKIAQPAAATDANPT